MPRSLSLDETRRLLADRTGVPEATAAVRFVNVARHQYLKKGTGRKNVEAWEAAARAVRALLDPETMAAYDSVKRLVGHAGTRRFITDLARKPRARLSPEEREERRRKGVDRRSTKLAKEAERHLAAARMSLVKAQRAVARAEATVKKWTEKVRYHQKLGRLAPDEEEG